MSEEFAFNAMLQRLEGLFFFSWMKFENLVLEYYITAAPKERHLKLTQRSEPTRHHSIDLVHDDDDDEVDDSCRGFHRGPNV